MISSWVYPQEPPEKRDQGDEDGREKRRARPAILLLSIDLVFHDFARFGRGLLVIVPIDRYLPVS